MKKMTREQINALPVTDKEKKSNEAFAKLAAIIKYYNDGWKPTKEDLGYFVYSRKWIRLLDGGSKAGSPSGFAFSDSAFSDSISSCGARLTLRDRGLCEFMMENYKQLYKDLWLEDAK